LPKSAYVSTFQSLGLKTITSLGKRGFADVTKDFDKRLSCITWIDPKFNNKLRDI